MLRGRIDVFLDPFKGQPWYEAVLWGWMAKECGLVVSDGKGGEIDFAQILREEHQRFLSGEKGEEVRRVTLVITTNKGLHQEILGGLQPSIQEGVIFDGEKGL